MSYYMELTILMCVTAGLAVLAASTNGLTVLCCLLYGSLRSKPESSVLFYLSLVNSLTGCIVLVELVLLFNLVTDVPPIVLCVTVIAVLRMCSTIAQCVLVFFGVRQLMVMWNPLGDKKRMNWHNTSNIVAVIVLVSLWLPMAYALRHDPTADCRSTLLLKGKVLGISLLVMYGAFFLSVTSLTGLLFWAIRRNVRLLQQIIKTDNDALFKITFHAEPASTSAGDNPNPNTKPHQLGPTIHLSGENKRFTLRKQIKLAKLVLSLIGLFLLAYVVVVLLNVFVKPWFSPLGQLMVTVIMPPLFTPCASFWLYLYFSPDLVSHLQIFSSRMF